MDVDLLLMGSISRSSTWEEKKKVDAAANEFTILIKKKFFLLILIFQTEWYNYLIAKKKIP